MPLKERFTRDNGTGLVPRRRVRTSDDVARQRREDAARDSAFPQPDSQTVVRAKPRQAPDLGWRNVRAVIDGQEVTIQLQVNDLIRALTTAPAL